MSIEHENFDNILQHKDEKDLEQYGVWVKKPAEEEAQQKEQEIDSCYPPGFSKKKYH